MTEITVRGSAEVRVLPDLAVVHAEISADSGSRDAAYEAAAQTAAAIDAVLADHAAHIAHATTTALAVAQKSRWHKGQHQPAGWRASRATSVEVSALDEVGALLARLSAAGASVHGPHWQISPGNAAHTSVRAAAAADARDRAVAYAAGLGVTVGAVSWIAEPGLRLAGATGLDPFPQPGAAPLARMQARGGGGPDEEVVIAVAPEEITLHATVEVGFAFSA